MLAYNVTMHLPGDITSMDGSAVTLPLSGKWFLMIREFVRAIKKLVIDKKALRRGDLITLRQIASLFVFGLMLVIAIAIAWPELVIANALANINRAQQNTHYPPQTQTVP